MKVRTPHNAHWVIVTFKRPVMWTRNDDEVWTFNPKRRYVLNADQLGNLAEFIETISDLATSPHYKPLQAGSDIRLAGSSLLVERFRERGIGDLLFMTGPLGFIHHVSGGEVGIDMYALADRGVILANHPVLRHKATLVGPLHYDDLPQYNYHWMVDTVTEYDEEKDQLNVYDALFKSMGFDPESISPQFKRPSVTLDENDTKHLDQFFYYVWLEKKIDLRKTGYYVVAPMARGSLRSAPYGTWLKVIRDLANRRPVVVVGDLTGRVPCTDMEGGDFNQHVSQSGGNVINAMNATPPLRVLMSIISKAVAVGCLDSGPLYLAQALNTPAVSVWGPHDPRVRIGYDKNYMDLAVWNKPACRFAPCFAYDSFPTHKCPRGAEQTVCEPLLTVDPSAILEKFAQVESAQTSIHPIAPAK